MTRTVIDIHPHVITTDEARYPRNPLGGTQSTWSAERPITAEQMVAEMDQAGVARSAVVQASTCYGHDNSYLADSVDAYPDRFTGVVSVDIRADDALDELNYWIGSRGLSGLRIFTTGSTMPAQGAWLDAPESYPAWGWAAEHDIPICVQMRMEGIPQLRTMLKHFPHTRVVLDHLARTPIEEGPPYAGSYELFALADAPQVYLKLTTNALEASREGNASPETFFPELVKRFGAERIAWGSNFPARPGPLAHLVHLATSTLEGVLADHELDQIFAGTALDLYPRLRPQPAAAPAAVETPNGEDFTA